MAKISDRQHKEMIALFAECQKKKNEGDEDDAEGTVNYAIVVDENANKWEKYSRRRQCDRKVHCLRYFNVQETSFPVRYNAPRVSRVCT